MRATDAARPGRATLAGGARADHSDPLGKAVETMTRMLDARWLAVLALLWPAWAWPAEELSGKIVEGPDPGALYLRHDGQTAQLIPFGVGWPAPEEAFGPQTQNYLNRQARGREVLVSVIGREADGTILGWVRRAGDGVDISREMLKAGAAWWDWSAAPHADDLAVLQQQARERAIGLWGEGYRPIQRGRFAVRGGDGGATDWLIPAVMGLTILALLAVIAMLTLSDRRGRGGARPEPAPTAEPQPAENDEPTPEEQAAERMATTKRDIGNIVDDISDHVDDMLEKQAKHSIKVKSHEMSVAKVETGMEIERLKEKLLGELAEIRKTADQYRDQLTAANRQIAQQRDMIDKIQTDAAIDFLTRLPNRNAFEERLLAEIATAQETRRALSLVAVDLDSLRHVNKKYGMMAGDRLLQLIGHLLERHVSDEQFVARYAGDRFIVILPDTPVKQARAYADTLRREISETALLFEKKQIGITASLSVGELDRGKDVPETLLNRIDAALYEITLTGGNRVIVAEL